MKDIIKWLSFGHIKSEEVIPSIIARTAKYFLRKMNFSVPVLEFDKELQGEKLNIVDIGANRGQFLKKSLLAYPNSNFYVIEPQIQLIDEMKRQFKSKRQSIEFFQVGISDSEGMLGLLEASNSGGSSFLEPNKRYKEDNPEISFKPAGSVKVTTVDKLFEGLDEIHLMKIDVEGLEANVIKGAKATLPRICYIHLEFGMNRYENPLITLSEISTLLSNTHDLIKLENIHYNSLGYLVSFDAVFSNKN